MEQTEHMDATEHIEATEDMDATEHNACGHPDGCGHSHSTCDGNISDQERLASLLGGGALALLGLSRRSWGGLGLALAGVGLLYRGITRHCQLYEKLGISTAEVDYDAYYDAKASAESKS